MKITLRRVAGLLVVATAAFSAACSAPSAVNPPDARASWGQHREQQPQELWPAYSYTRAGGG